MFLVEQAIFTSQRSAEGAGYHLAARSPGVTAELARELAAWGPAHDSLRDPRPGARSVNYHPLSDGWCCVSLSVNAGAEYSGRRGARVYTHQLLAPRPALAQLGNRPLELLRAAEIAGRLEIRGEVPAVLAPFPLVGRSPRVDPLVTQAAEARFGAAVLNELAEAALSGDRLAVVCPGPVEELLAALGCLWPWDARLEISFTTGLRRSPRRPFRLAFLPEDEAEIRQADREEEVRVLDLREHASAAPANGVLSRAPVPI